MEKVIRYKCSYCGLLFETEEECLKDEAAHINIKKANEMFLRGATLQEINKTCHIWDKLPKFYNLPEFLQKVTKDSYK